MIKNVDQPFYAGDTSLIRAVGRGECGVSVVNHYYLARMQAGISGKKDSLLAKNVTLVMPNPAHVNISAAGLAKSAKNKKEAIQLIKFLTSTDGSKGIAGPTYEYPLNGYGEAKELKNFGEFSSDNVSINELSKVQKSAIKIMAKNGWR